MAKMKGGMDPEYQAQSDMRTLAEAHAIKKDPKRHKAAKDHAKKKIAEMGKVIGPTGDGGDSDGDDDGD